MKKAIGLVLIGLFLSGCAETVALLGPASTSSLTGGNIIQSATTSVVSYQFRSKFGILDIKKNNLVSDFIEKPLLNHWLNIGYFYFENKALKNLKKYKSFEDFFKVFD